MKSTSINRASRNLPRPFRSFALSILSAGRVLVVSCVLILSSGAVQAGVAYGSINNFDTVNDTGVECHGFEIELEDCHSTDITYTYNWNHYGVPQISEDNSDPLHPRVFVRYASAKNADGSWAAYTAIPSGPIAPTQGHQFTNPSVNFGGEHFGVGYRVTPTAVKYHWLIDDGSGGLILGPAVNVATPTFTYVPPAAGVPAQVQAAIVPPPAPPVLEFGPASWVKEIRTETHNNNEVKLRDLVSDDPDDPEDVNWRNGEPDEVEVEWQLLQTDFNAGDGGANGELKGAPEDLANGDEVITRRYEFYKYIGPIDLESGEAKADKVAPDGIHGVGIKRINGEEVDLSTVEIVGDYLGAQMSAFDLDAAVGLIEHLQDGAMNTEYPARTVVIGGSLPFTAATTGDLPEGMTFDPITGVVSGTPLVSGEFTFTVTASDANTPEVAQTYVFDIAPEGVDLPPHSLVDTRVAPANGGMATGAGSYLNGDNVTVEATPNAGYVFINWMEHGAVVSASASYQFTIGVNRSLVANFITHPTLSRTVVSSGTLMLAWPSGAEGWRLEESPDLSPGSWTNANRPFQVVGEEKQVTLSPLTATRFFRLVYP